MKKKSIKFVFVLFVLVAIAQLFVPIQMIFGQEHILKTGTPYKFKTQPIDPSDPFRGKYITLRYAVNLGATNDSIWNRNEDVYVYLKTDSLGFAEVKQISRQPLELTNDYVIAKANWYNYNTGELSFNLPFNRFYMKETKAKPAEDAFRKAQLDSLPNNTYGLVYVKDGKSVLDNVFINDIPIADFVEGL